MDEQQPNVPHGFCQCGCGARAPIARQTRTHLGYRRGEPVRFCRGHAARLQAKRDFGPPPPCRCGCGQDVERVPGGWRKYAPGHYHLSRRPAHAPFGEQDLFWSWFAGFTDGEGCFGVLVSTVGGRRYPQPYFKIAVRADERPILEEIRDRLGCGRVRVHVPGAATSNLQLKFEVSAIADCRRLIEVFSRYPLRAKKRRDFETWAEAVREKAANGTSPRIWELRDRLVAGRQYDATLAQEVI